MTKHINKILSLACIGGGFLFAPLAQSDTPVYQETFEGGSPLSSWSINADASTSATVASDPNGATSPLGNPNNALFLDDKNNAGKVEANLAGLSATYGNNSAQTQFRFSYDMLTATVGSFAGVEFNLYGSDTVGGTDERMIRIRNPANERIGVYDGATEVEYNNVFTKDTWHRVVVDINLDTSTFDWSITDLDTSDVVANNTGYAFETATTKTYVSSFRFASFGSATGEYHFDNLSLVTIPEPSTAALVLIFGVGFLGIFRTRPWKR